MDSRTFFKAIKSNPERFYLIHYSSQALYDEGLDGLSPRITSIVVMHFSTRQTVSFALHAVAETLGIPKEKIAESYNQIEETLLERFYEFVRYRRQMYWVHWNMQNITYGFEHLEHRYRCLTGKNAPHVPVEVRLDLSDMLKERYGPDYAAHKRMKNLMLLNGPLDQRFLDGPGESEAFKKMEFIRMNSSTISKVEFFRHVIGLVQRGKLHTAGKGLGARIDRLLESRVARVLALVAAAVGFGPTVAFALSFLPL